MGELSFAHVHDVVAELERRVSRNRLVFDLSWVLYSNADELRHVWHRSMLGDNTAGG